MPRNRMIKAEFWADEKVAACGLIARLLFIGSWNFADDSGVCRANSAYLRNNIFPYDSINIKDIDKALEQLQENGLIKIGVYKNEKYLLIKNFLTHQKINRPSEQRYIKSSYDEVFKDYSLQSHGVLNEYSLLKENEKEKEKEKEKCEETRTIAIDELSQWWGEYANVHLDKSQYDKLLNLTASNELLNALIEQLSENIACKKEAVFDPQSPHIHFVRLKRYLEQWRLNPKKNQGVLDPKKEKAKRLKEMRYVYERLKEDSG